MQTQKRYKSLTKGQNYAMTSIYLRERGGAKRRRVSIVLASELMIFARKWPPQVLTRSATPGRVRGIGTKSQHDGKVKLGKIFRKIKILRS